MRGETWMTVPLAGVTEFRFLPMVPFVLGWTSAGATVWLSEETWKYSCQIHINVINDIYLYTFISKYIDSRIKFKVI